MKKSPDQPAQPDPRATAAAQAAANKEAAIAGGQLSMVNQYTPQGSLEYSERGKTAEGTPQYSVTQTLSPEQQALYDLTAQAGQKYGQTANAQLDAVSGKLSQPLDYTGIGAAPVLNEQTRQAVAQSMYDRMNPQFDRDRAALETRLANQGITLNSEAYGRAMDEQNRAKNDARLAIESQALGQAGQLYGIESSARDRAINEMIQQRSQPLNELAAMMSGSQVQGPQFVNTPQMSVAPADIAGMTYANYSGAQNAYNQNMANQRAGTQGLYGLLGSGVNAAGWYWGGR